LLHPPIKATLPPVHAGLDRAIRFHRRCFGSTGEPDDGGKGSVEAAGRHRSIELNANEGDMENSEWKIRCKARGERTGELPVDAVNAENVRIRRALVRQGQAALSPLACRSNECPG
jgi:hypothetical protein